MKRKFVTGGDWAPENEMDEENLSEEENEEKGGKNKKG